jgi:hypothetical protein
MTIHLLNRIFCVGKKTYDSSESQPYLQNKKAVGLNSVRI